MKNILGLDLGTNSIGWALIQTDDAGNYQHEIKLGSRIIPMTQDIMSAFDGGKPIETPTASRTRSRGMRRLYERRALRRERLLRVLHTLGFLPTHFDEAIGWNPRDTKTYGKFIDLVAEPKLAWKQGNDGKPEFLFMTSFEEMLADFAQHQPSLVQGGKKIAYDWTLYYLRQKALTAPITKEELAWILLNFNQKRGYYQLRGKDEDTNQEEDKSKRVEYIMQRVVAVEADTDSRPSDKGLWYNVHLENGMLYRRQSRENLEGWVGRMREFIVTTQLNPDGSEKIDADGNVKRTFKAPGADDWSLRKVRTEHNLADSGLTVGAYIYQHLLQNPSDKIIGKFVETIERHYYKEELYAILRKQEQYHPELRNASLLEACILELYTRNEAHQANLKQKDLAHLLIEDILFYQRPLKSKKSLISECPYEKQVFVDKNTGEVRTQHLKCVAKNNPYFQEFRLLQFIQNLKVYDTTGLDEADVTQQYIPDAEARTRLYQWLNERENVTQEAFLKDFLGIKKPKGKDAKYPLRWNYVEDKTYPAGETHSLLLKALKKASADVALLYDPATEYRLWHLLYSIDDVKELEGALKKFADLYHVNDAAEFVKVFAKLKPFGKEYGGYSEKAIKKLIPAMRSGLRLHEACYEIYGLYSEGLDAKRWTSPADIHTYIQQFQQHSLRNPIVEQCILETLRTVADIWQQNGHIDEIHLELGREMKNPADKRKRISEQNQRNENTNLRIKALLQELLNDPSVSDVRPNSPMQQDILRIYEEGALLELKADDPEYKDILAISQMAQPTISQITRYKLWLEQRYRSPYTGRVIPLAKLFTPAYQIEHIIPRARYYDDSLGNKVICEAEVNKLKDNKLAHEFISSHGGQIVTTVSGQVRVFTRAEYDQFVKEHYAQQKNKQRRLMLDDIPEEFIQRQLNDSRYISKVIKSLLSNIVREEGEDQDMSKNVIVCTGGVTDRLKRDWGLNDVWNHLVYPRYERLNELTGTTLFGQWETKEGGKRVFQTNMPLALQQGYSKKRIDHRHHAMDALVIACASRNIVNLLSNQNANLIMQREDLKRQLSGKGGLLYKPWQTFTEDAERALAGVVVSFKHKERVLARATNKYEHYDAEGRKQLVAQTGGKQLVVRKPMHKESVFAHVNLIRTKEVSLDTALNDVKNIADKTLRNHIVDLFSQGLDKKKIKKQLAEEGVGKKIEVRYQTDSEEPLCAIRKKLDETFDKKRILAITDTGIQKILLCYLEAKGGDAKVAFSPEGIEELNENIALYNNGKAHQPIRSVRCTETLGTKFAVGYIGNKSKKFVEAQSGTNLFFAIYEKEGVRSYATLPLNEVVERTKQGLSPAPELNEEGACLKFTLSPNDLVYVPTEEEKQMPALSVNELNPERIYKFINGTKKQSYFIPHRISSSLLALKKDFDWGNNRTVVHEISVGNSLGKIETLENGQTIKSICWKLEIDRLGNITKIIR